MYPRLSVILLVLLFFASCGGSNATRGLEEMQKKNADLTQRVKTLEDNLLATDKKVIQLQQALQQINSRVRDMEATIDQVRMAAR